MEVGLGVPVDIALFVIVQFLEAFQKVFEGHILLCNMSCLNIFVYFCQFFVFSLFVLYRFTLCHPYMFFNLYYCHNSFYCKYIAGIHLELVVLHHIVIGQPSNFFFQQISSACVNKCSTQTVHMHVPKHVHCLQCCCPSASIGSNLEICCLVGVDCPPVKQKEQ